jgi:anti-repressor protein
MNGLIKVDVNEDMEQVVSGRELHEFLEVSTPYTMWMERRIEDCGFSEGEDFLTNLLESTGGRPSADHTLKMDMAKELCMLEKNARGKQARQYFIRIEKAWNSPDLTMARAIQLADKKIRRLEIQMKEQEPLVIAGGAIQASANSVLIREFVKVAAKKGIDIGEKRFFNKLREEGFLMRHSSTGDSLPTQRAVELGVLEVVERPIHASEKIITRFTTRITGKGQVYFLNRLLKEGAV